MFYLISTTTSIHLTSQQAPINPSPDTNTMKTPITMKTMDRLLARSPSLYPATSTLLRAGVTSEERAFIFTNIPATKSPRPRTCNFSHKNGKIISSFIFCMTKQVIILIKRVFKNERIMSGIYVMYKI